MLGIDIFNGTNITSWESLKASGIQVVYIKATEGRTYQNPALKAQYNGAKSVGMLVGFYHFAGKVSTVDQEYTNFINTTKGYVADLKPCLDYELDNPMATWINVFMQKDDKLILYINHSILNLVSYPSNKIWIAEPTDVPGSSFRTPTDTRGYAGIQHKFHGRLNGLNGDADIDLFSDGILLGKNVILTSQPVSSEPKLQVNETIRQLQCNFNLLHIADLKTDGIPGPKTTAAIMKFQGIMGLKVDGILGPNTQGAIADILARPLDGFSRPHFEFATRYIQFRLGISIDGVFGVGTDKAVRLWQSKNGLIADGLVGNLSWRKLL